MLRVGYSETVVDLSSRDSRNRLHRVADKILAGASLPEPDTEIDHQRWSLAHLLARSKARASRVPHKTSIAIVFPMWREVNRLSPKTSANPFGEDSLRAKVHALDWLFAETSVEWHIFAVDDGCPMGSAAVAKSIVSESQLERRVSVVSLSDHLPTERRPLKALNDPDDSTKAGAIILGCQTAADSGFDLISYTDCDNSVYVAQVGNFFPSEKTTGKPWLALGSRYMDSSYVRRAKTRAVGGRYKILRHIRELMQLTDKLPADYTCGLKLFPASLVESVLPELSIFDFSFEYELIVSAVSQGYEIEEVGCSFLDSIEFSTWKYFGQEQVWMDQLHGLASSLIKYDIGHDQLLCEFVLREINSVDRVRALAQAVLPPSFTDSADERVGDPTVLSSTDTMTWCQRIFVEMESK